MKNILLSSLLTSLFILQTSCGVNGDEPAFGDGDGGISDTPSTTSFVNNKNFFMLANPVNLAAIVIDATTGATTFTEKTAVITVHVGDRDGFFIGDNITVHFAVEWGFLSDSSCVTTDGSCSVTFTTGDPSNMPPDAQPTITAYTQGEEEFPDPNNNNALDNGETFVDTDTPFIDIDDGTIGHNGVYDAGVDQPVGVRPHQDPDGQFSGENCNDTTGRCSGNTKTYIYDIFSLQLIQ